MEYLFTILKSVQPEIEGGRKFLPFIVYLATLLDNVLLTVIDYLTQIDNHPNENAFNNPSESLKYKNLYLKYVSGIFSGTGLVPNASIPLDPNYDIATKKLLNESQLNEENGAVGILLATKALIQLLSTPLVKNLANSFGYRIPIAVGTFVLLLASITFGIGQSYFWLLLARAMQDFASACISVCGMSLIAKIYPEEKMRSQIIGIILGSMELGVLIGYPFGGILYAFSGKSAPFYIILILISFTLALQLIYMDLLLLSFIALYGS